MGGDGVIDISAGADEGVGRMVNGAGLTSGSMTRSGANGGGRAVGTETRVDNELAKVGGFRKVTSVNPPHSTFAPAALKVLLQSPVFYC